jgi:arsenite methyltransferase
MVPESILRTVEKNVVEPDSATLRDSVRIAYSRAAHSPAEKHPFPVGVEFALSLGYPPEFLNTIPRTAIEAFTGVSNVSVFATLPAGATVIDLGCGSGLDSLIAAQRVGARGRVVGIDFSEAMLDRANSSLRGLELANVLFLRSAAEELPLTGASVDRALVNGIFNLNPFREAISSELARIVRPGGCVSGAELVLQAPLQETSRVGAANWFS